MCDWPRIRSNIEPLPQPKKVLEEALPYYIDVTSTVAVFSRNLYEQPRGCFHSAVSCHAFPLKKIMRGRL